MAAGRVGLTQGLSPKPVATPNTGFIDGSRNAVIDGNRNWIVLYTRPVVSASDTVNYIFQFDSLAAAGRDTVIGSYFQQPNPTALETVIWGNLGVDSVNTLPGYWPMISTKGLDDNLFLHPNVQIVVNQTAKLAGQPCVLLNNVPITDIGIVFNAFGTYTEIGLLE
jgi:hypothetical protein